MVGSVWVAQAPAPDRYPGGISITSTLAALFHLDNCELSVFLQEWALQ